MKRSEHLFQFTGKQIGEAALRCAAYHRERLAWWKEEHAKAIVKAKASGVEVREQPVTGGVRAQIVVDHEAQARMSECGAKIDAHRAAADKFKIEGDCYGTQPMRSYELHPDDVVYFRLVGGPKED